MNAEVLLSALLSSSALLNSGGKSGRVANTNTLPLNIKSLQRFLTALQMDLQQKFNGDGDVIFMFRT